MEKTRLIGGVVALVVAAAGTSEGFAQTYPSKPINIVTSGVGGGSDFVARQVAQGITGPLGQPVTVDNKGGGIVQGDIVSKAPPDGYTLLIQGSSFWVGPLIRKTPYDSVRDFAPISLLASSPVVLVVHSSLPVKSVKELIALAKAKPGQLNYAANGVGGSNQLSAELFKSMAGVNIVRIPYKSGSQLLADLIGGQVQMVFDTTSQLMPNIQAGKLRPLAVTSAEPSKQFPDLPTIASTLPGYASESTTGMFAPAKTPTAIINRLNQEVVRYLSTPEAKERFLTTGTEVLSSSPEQFANIIKSDMVRLGKVIKDAGIHEDD